MKHILKALHKLEAGDWNAAHKIAQDDESEAGSWLHGIVHIVEGDESNARYWYQRAGREFPGMNAVESESAALRTAVGG
jgi:hypothetical protein